MLVDSVMSTISIEEYCMEKKEYGVVSITVDKQKDFCTPEGSLYVPGAETTVEEINLFNAKVREIGGLNIFTRDWHPPETNHFEKFPVHCVANTTGSEFHDDLEILPGDLIINKGTEKDVDGFSAFEGESDTDGKKLKEIINEQLGKHAVLLVVVMGDATEFCDKSLVIDFADIYKQEINDSKLVLVALVKYMRAVAEADGKKAIEEMQNAGALTEIPERYIL
jgi:nicotinamidase/pyrazinamidase